MNNAPPLVKFRTIVNNLLDQGVAPTPTVFQQRGLGYTAGVGSGCTWISGKYAQARREELLKRGWTYVERPNARYEGQGRWQPPKEA